MNTNTTIWGKHGFLACAACGHIVITYGKNDIKDGQPAYCHFCHRQFIPNKKKSR